MSAMTGSKRAREAQVKLEDGISQAVAQPNAQPNAAVDKPAKTAFNLAEVTHTGHKIRNVISSYSQAFIVTGPNIPIVLHFKLSDWTKSFHDTLLSHGLEEDAVYSQVGATLTLMLAQWTKYVSETDTAKALGVNERWIIEPYVKEAIKLGYFPTDKEKMMERIIRTIHEMPFSNDSD